MGKLKWIYNLKIIKFYNFTLIQIFFKQNKAI